VAETMLVGSCFPVLLAQLPSSFVGFALGGTNHACVQLLSSFVGPALAGRQYQHCKGKAKET